MGAAEQLVHEAFVDTGIRSEDRDRWLAMRRTGLGASEAAAVVGESRWSDPGRVYAVKTGALKDDAGHERLEWGLLLEPVMLGAYASARYAGREVRADRRLLRSTSHAWALTTLDAETYRADRDGWGPLELKTTDSRHANEDWGTGTVRLDGHGVDMVPIEYWWQLQQQMLVKGSGWASIACLIGPHRFVWDDVDRDEVAIRRLVRAGAELWDRIARRDPPPTRDRSVLQALYPRDDGRTLQLGGELLSLDARRCELTEQRKDIERELDDINAQIESALGNATRGELPGGAAYSWKVVNRRERVQPASSTRVLRRHAAPHERDAERGDPH